MGTPSQPPQVKPTQVPGPNAPRQSSDDGGRVMEVLTQRVSSGHTSPEELLAMLTRQRQTQVELQRAQQQQQQQQREQQQQRQHIPVASLFGQQLPQVQPPQQRGAP